MKKEDKKALSPVIATVLLIALVLVLASIVFLWARGFVSERIEKFGGIPIQETCSEVGFDFEIYPREGGGEYDFEIVNQGNIPIYDFELKQFQGGNSFPGALDPLGAFSINSGDSKSISAIHLGTIDKIILYPRILGSISGSNKGQVFTCLENGKTKTI